MYAMAAIPVGGITTYNIYIFIYYIIYHILYMYT
jgi:hypothetical protein